MATRREQIEDVASALFSDRGYKATSMRDIAAALDIQGGSLYAHIPSKEAVLASIVEQAAERFHQAVRPVAEGRARAHVFLFEWTSLGPERREAVARSRDAYESYFKNVIAEGVAAGELARRDARLAAIFLLSAMNGLVHWYRPDGPLGPEAIAEHYADLFLCGLGRGHSPGHSPGRTQEATAATAGGSL